MGKKKKLKCCHCRRMFEPDFRNHGRQKYCSQAECRKESKAASQKKWLKKPENKDHFKGLEHVERVKEWRGNNPGYSKRSVSDKDKTRIALQDPLIVQHAEITNDNHSFDAKALQDSLERQHLVIVGLISQFTGLSLQDDIASTLTRMQQSGQDILYRQLQNKGECYGFKIPGFTQAGP